MRQKTRERFVTCLVIYIRIYIEIMIKYLLHGYATRRAPPHSPNAFFFNDSPNRNCGRFHSGRSRAQFEAWQRASGGNLSNKVKIQLSVDHALQRSRFQLGSHRLFTSKNKPDSMGNLPSEPGFYFRFQRAPESPPRFCPAPRRGDESRDDAISVKASWRPVSSLPASWPRPRLPLSG